MLPSHPLQIPGRGVGRFSLGLDSGEVDGCSGGGRWTVSSTVKYYSLLVLYVRTEVDCRQAIGEIW